MEWLRGAASPEVPLPVLSRLLSRPLRETSWDRGAPAACSAPWCSHLAEQATWTTPCLLTHVHGRFSDRETRFRYLTINVYQNPQQDSELRKIRGKAIILWCNKPPASKPTVKLHTRCTHTHTRTLHLPSE